MRRLLARFLASPSPNAYSPDQLEHLYLSTKHARLSPAQYSAIIGIYGSLSLPADSPRIKSRYALASDRKQDYWSFMLQVVQDKLQMGLHLNDGDRYWLMSARLHDFNTFKHEEPDRAFAALAEATSHYNVIWSRTQVPEILVPYLETLLSTHQARAIDHLSDLLAVHSNIHSRFLAMLWKLLMQPVESVPTLPKERFLRTLQNRLSMHHPHNPTSRGRAMATHRFDPVSGRHFRLVVDTSQLLATLTSTLFPFYSVPVPLPVKQWAYHQARTVLAHSPTNSTGPRWNNLSLLALYHLSKSNLAFTAKLFNSPFPSTFEDWHVVLALGLLENVVTSGDHNQTEEIRMVTRNVWSKWKDKMSPNSAGRPIFVERAVMSSFLKLAGIVKYPRLLEDCLEYVKTKDLWVMRGTRADQAQARCLIGDFVEAWAKCYGPQWGRILDLVEAEVVLDELKRRDVGLAYDFFKHCRTAISPASIVELGRVLCSSRYDLVVPMLRYESLNTCQKETLLRSILEAIRTHRCRYLDPISASIIARTMTRIYTKHKPDSQLAYPIRYILPLLVIAGRTNESLRLIRSIPPSFFTPHFFRRMLRVLIQHRQFKAAVRLYNLRREHASLPERDYLRRKLVFSLTHRGAPRLAKKCFHNFSPRLREMLVRRVDFRLGSPNRSQSIHALSLLGQKETDVPTLRSAFLILLNSGRPVAALRLYQSHVSSGTLDSKAKTWFGNVFLHRLLRRQIRTRNKRGIKKMLETKEFLQTKLGFEEDRVTVNIVVKALLKWERVLDTENVQALFDNLVRSGYPVEERWRRRNDVPFGTNAATSITGTSSVLAWLSNLKSRISFERHTKPLYKMFIKAFHARRDVGSAKMVIGILKEQEAQAIHLAQQRRRPSRSV